MAYENQFALKIGTLAAASDLSGKQYRLVKLASATTVDVCSAITDVPIGVLQNKPTSGQAAEILVIGLTKISVDADIAALDWIGPSNDGQAAKVTIGTDTTVHIVGKVITEPGGADEIHTAVVNCVTPVRGLTNIL
jgi:hypothetical protein